MQKITRMRIKTSGREALEAVRSYMINFSCGAIDYESSGKGFVLVFRDEYDLKIAKLEFGDLLEEVPAPRLMSRSRSASHLCLVG